VGATEGTNDAPDRFPTGLASEVEALSRQLEALSLPTSTGAAFDPTARASEVLRVQADLTSRMMQAANRTSSDPDSSPGAVYELFVTPKASTDEQAIALKNAELEQRLAAVESALGGEHIVSSGSIVEKVERLETKVDLLDAAKIESVGRKAAGLATHLSSLVKQKRQVAPSSDQETLIDTLHKTLERWDSVAAAIPSVVSRLHALKNLQDTSLTVAATVHKMEDAHTSLTAEIKAQAGHISSVEQSFVDNAAAISSNIASLEARIEAISQHMNK